MCVYYFIWALDESGPFHLVGSLIWNWVYVYKRWHYNKMKIRNMANDKIEACFMKNVRVKRRIS